MFSLIVNCSSSIPCPKKGIVTHPLQLGAASILPCPTVHFHFYLCVNSMISKWGFNPFVTDFFNLNTCISFFQSDFLHLLSFQYIWVFLQHNESLLSTIRQNKLSYQISVSPKPWVYDFFSFLFSSWCYSHRCCYHGLPLDTSLEDHVMLPSFWIILSYTVLSELTISLHSKLLDFSLYFSIR